ncbi:hypothetical protein CL658_05070 [bacterium]|nr:hypothetical protein [bacterium]
MNKIKSIILICISLYWILSPLHAELKWEKEFPHMVTQKNRKMAPDGSMLIWGATATAKRSQGRGVYTKFTSPTTVSRIDSETGELLWKSNLTYAINSLKFIPGSVYGEIASQKRDFSPNVDLIESKVNKKSKLGKLSKFGSSALNAYHNETKDPSKNVFKVKDIELLDLRNGKIIVKEKNIIDYKVLKKTGKILVYGFIDTLKQPSIGLYDEKTGEKIWSTTSVFKTKKTSVKVKNLNINLNVELDALIADPIDLSDNTLLITLKTGIHKLDMKTGESLWNITLPKPKIIRGNPQEYKKFNSVKVLLSPVDKTSFFYIDTKSFRMMRYSLKDGKEEWNSFAKITSIIDKVIYTPKGVILTPKAGSGAAMQKTKIYYIDYITGKSLWKSDFLKIKGGVKEYKFAENDKLLLQLENVNNSNFITILDINSGKFLFKKDKKVKGTLNYVEKIDQGYLYITTKEINVLNTKGKKILKKSLKMKNIITKNQKNKIYLYDVEALKLFSLDKTNLELKKIAKLPKPKGKETYNVMDIIDNVIVFSSYRNVIRLSENGEILSHDYYKQPGSTKFGKATLFLAAASTGPAGIFVYGIPLAIDSIGGGVLTGNEFDEKARQNANNVQKPYFINDPIYNRIVSRIKRKTIRYKTVIVGFEKYKSIAKKTVNNIKDSKLKTKKSAGIAVIDKKTGEIPLLINIGSSQEEKKYIMDDFQKLVILNPTPEKYNLMTGLKKITKTKEDYKLDIYKAELSTKKTLNAYTW